MENVNMEISKGLYKKFNKLKFDHVSHSYYISGVQYPSVSKLISQFYTPFDTESVATGVAISRGVQREEVLKEWDQIRDEACTRGTRVHDFGERYVINKYGLRTKITFKSVNQHLKKGESLSGQEQAVVNFWGDIPDYYVPVVMELQMYSEEFEYAGTADIILLDKRNNTLVIADYKTNKDLFKQYGDNKLLEPFNHLNENPLNKYVIQLSYYQILLEQFGMKVSRRFIVWLKHDATYQIYNTDDYTGTLLNHLNKKKEYANW